MREKLSSRRGALLVVGVLAALTVFLQLTSSAWPLRRSGGASTIDSRIDPGLTGSFSAGTGAPVALEARLDRTAVLQGGDGLVRMELAIRAVGRPALSAERVPTDLVVVLDRSGSMSGSKIEHARQATRLVVDSLADGDRFALVTYAGDAALTIPLAEASPAARARWIQTIAGTGAGGGTNISNALDLALATLERAQRPGRAARLILISDGQANQGDVTLEGLSERARRAARAESVLSAVGVGEDFNETLMAALADAGTGNYYYLRNAEELARVFESEFKATRTTLADALSVTLTPGPHVTVADVAGYPLERAAGRVSFRPGSLYAGQERRVWVSYHVASAEPGSRDLGGVELSWKDTRGQAASLALASRPAVTCVRDEAAFVASIDKDVWEDSVVKEAYGALKQRVAGYVMQGDRAAARQEIEAYRARNSVLNEEVQSPAVMDNLQELSHLESDVDDAFAGAPEERKAKQNRLSKKSQAEGWDSRREGSKLVEGGR